MITIEDYNTHRDKALKALEKMKEREKDTVIYQRIKIPNGVIEKRRKVINNQKPDNHVHKKRTQAG